MGARNVLFIQTAFLGDVVLATAGMEAWHQVSIHTRFMCWSASPWIACSKGIHGLGKVLVGQTSEGQRERIGAGWFGRFGKPVTTWWSTSIGTPRAAS